MALCSVPMRTRYSTDVTVPANRLQFPQKRLRNMADATDNSSISEQERSKATQKILSVKHVTSLHFTT